MNQTDILDTRNKIDFLAQFKTAIRKPMFKFLLWLAAATVMMFLTYLLHTPSIDRSNLTIIGKYITYDDNDLGKPKYHLLMTREDVSNGNKYDPIAYSSLRCDKKEFIDNKIPTNFTSDNITDHKEVFCLNLLLICSFFCIILIFVCI